MLNGSPFYFQATTDSYGANSGFAVFNASTDEVEGIWVHGGRGGVIDGKKSCVRSFVCEEG